MATTTIPFSFICSIENDITMLGPYNHAITSSLVTPTPASGHRDLLDTIIDPIINAHRAELTATCAKRCILCLEPSTRLTFVPNSHLRRVENPQFTVFTSPICEKKECERKAQQVWIGRVGKMADELDPEEVRGDEENVTCRTVPS